MSKKPEFKSISVKEELAESIEKFVKQYPEFGYRSISQFMEDATRHHLQELKSQIVQLPRFEQINSDASGILIYDREIKGNKAVHVSIKPNGIRCDFHQSDTCEHVQFALSLPTVMDLIEKKRKEGWKIELPDV